MHPPETKLLRAGRLAALFLAVLPCLAAAQAAPASSAEPLDTSLLGRWGQFYRQDWTGALPQSAAAPRRGLPSPLDSPPFPNSDWSYGGSPVSESPTPKAIP